MCVVPGGCAALLCSLGGCAPLLCCAVFTCCPQRGWGGKHCCLVLTEFRHTRTMAGALYRAFFLCSFRVDSLGCRVLMGQWAGNRLC